MTDLFTDPLYPHDNQDALRERMQSQYNSDLRTAATVKIGKLSAFRRSVKMELVSGKITATSRSPSCAHWNPLTLTYSRGNTCKYPHLLVAD